MNAESELNRLSWFGYGTATRLVYFSAGVPARLKTSGMMQP